MKPLLRKLFSPLLNIFEKGTEPFDYKPLNRKILIFIGAIFLGLAILVFSLIPEGADPGYFLPVIVFFAIALVGLVVGLLGTDRAVSRIWGNR